MLSRPIVSLEELFYQFKYYYRIQTQLGASYIVKLNVNKTTDNMMILRWQMNDNMNKNNWWWKFLLVDRICLILTPCWQFWSPECTEQKNNTWFLYEDISQWYYGVGHCDIDPYKNPAAIILPFYRLSLSSVKKHIRGWNIGHWNMR